MRIIVSLFDQAQFFSLRLIEPTLDAVGFFEPFQGQDKQFGVMLVRKRREWNG